MSEQLTPWIGGSNPVYVGWYDVRWTTGFYARRWWSGTQWRESPVGQRSPCGMEFGDKFRGLAAPYPGWKA